MNNGQIVTLETAKLAKQKGFNWYSSFLYDEKGIKSNCLLVIRRYYENDPKDSWNVAAPTQSMLQKWLREEHDVVVYLRPIFDGSGRWSVYVDDYSGHHMVSDYVFKDTYEEALEIGLQLGLNEIK